jgi:hypothetical protein
MRGWKGKQENGEAGSGYQGAWALTPGSFLLVRDERSVSSARRLTTTRRYAKIVTSSESVAGFIREAVEEKVTRMRWQRNLESLRREIREAGGLELEGSKEEVIERLRKTRREIFETEYAHLYR